MSSKKVRKYIRAQRKAQKQAQKQQHVAGLADEGAPDEQGAGISTQTTSVPVAPAESRAKPGAAGGRLTAVLAGLGLVAAAGGSAALEFGTTHTEQPVIQSAHMVPAPSVSERLVCPPAPGQPDSLSEDGLMEYQPRDDSASYGHDAAVIASADGRLPTADWYQLDYEGSAEPEPFIEPDQTVETTAPSIAERPMVTEEFDTEPGAGVLQIQPLDGLSPSQDSAAALNFTYQADSGAVTGLTAGPCRVPERSQWFLGPESGTGANSLLTLANPHGRDATVEVTTFDAEGATGALGSSTLLVPSNSVRTLNLAGLAEGEAQLAVEVVAQGAPVTAHLQSAHAASGSGQGVEQLEAFSGLRQEHHALGVLSGADEDPQLWFYAPGDEHVTVELQVFDEDGQVEPDTPGVFSLEPGKVSVAGLHGLDAGVYDVQLTTDQPALAGVRSSGDGQPVTVEVELEPEIDPWTGLELEPETEERESDPAPDFSWAVGASPLEEGSAALLPADYDTELRLLAPAGEGTVQVSYRILDSSGESTDDLVEDIEPGTSGRVTAEDLQESAADADLDDAYAVLITEVEGEAYGGTVTRDEDGQFSVGRIEPLSQGSQYVPLRLEP